MAVLNMGLQKFLPEFSGRSPSEQDMIWFNFSILLWNMGPEEDLPLRRPGYPDSFFTDFSIKLLQATHDKYVNAYDHQIQGQVKAESVSASQSNFVKTRVTPATATPLAQASREQRFEISHKNNRYAVHSVALGKILVTAPLQNCGDFW